MMTKHIVLCADDYGQDASVNGAIIQLLRAKRISATSCLVNSPEWPEAAKELSPFFGHADIGLHFNLTEGAPLSSLYRHRYGDTFFPVVKLMYLSLLRQIELPAIQAELNAQLDAFQAATGQLPTFIDGHQHVHQFPIVRNAVISVYLERLKQYQPYIRVINCRLRKRDIFQSPKKLIISSMGTKTFLKLLKQHEIRHNSSFAGIYSFTSTRPYILYFQQFLDEVKENGIIMCHPGLAAGNVDDTIAATRFKEFQFLMGDDIRELCAAQSVEFCPLG